jgi:hypothetical protein
MPVRNLPGGSDDDPHRQRRPGEPRRSSSGPPAVCDRDGSRSFNLLPHLAVLGNITLLDAGAAAVGEPKRALTMPTCCSAAPPRRTDATMSVRALVRGASFPGRPDPPETQQSERE